MGEKSEIKEKHEQLIRKYDIVDEPSGMEKTPDMENEAVCRWWQEYKYQQVAFPRVNEWNKSSPWNRDKKLEDFVDYWCKRQMKERTVPQKVKEVRVQA